MNCLIARQILDLASPDDSRTQTVDEAMRHVDGCAGCQEAVRRYELFDKKLSAMLSSVPVPVGLKERLLDRLRGTVPDDSRDGGEEAATFRSRDEIPSNGFAVEGSAVKTASAVVAASPVLANPPVSSRLYRGSRRRWLGAISLAAAFVVFGFGTWSLWPRPPQYDLDEIVGDVADKALVPAGLPAFTEFADGLAPAVPATMMTGRLSLPARRLVDKDVAVYFFTVPFRGGPPLAGRLVVVPKRFVKTSQIPAASGFLAVTAYKAGFCTTTWCEGEFVYICCLSGGEAGMKSLIPTQSAPI